ncbi:lysophospholipid acyltransferase family protein [Haloplasma contractile]|uniref:1-acyl-sn-glycerol-3-phosphate acyltransferase n=1 Tax=Haloplasma contractile SSD-17B TaxID=1033810 RepID=U2FLF4_9MOLU|nr:lysophospholipid acyltransferase family protein [Haloplasma contractile]ERJ13575.1 1-acyl-sn-glycerol-3-phosphate acyltransferase putative protein [Haloplasma contractile SSD-17B]
MNNKTYLLPKVIFLTILFMIIFGLYDVLSIVLFTLASFIIALVFEVTYIYVKSLIFERRVEKGKSPSLQTIYNVVNRVMILVNNLLRINVIVKGYNHFDSQENYVIYSNHQSNADIIVMLEAFRDPIAFMAKKETSKIPIVSRWMRLMGCTFLDRKDVRAQIKTLKESINQVKNGYNMVIFPEGTRSKGSEMLDFKAGSLKIALKSKAKILPVTLNNVYTFSNKWPFRRTNVTVHIHEPMEYEMYMDLDTGELADKVKSIISTKIDKN